MADYDFTTDMDAEQVKRAKLAGKLAHKHVKGTTLYEAIEIGEVLLIGRAIAMRVSSSNAPVGRRYSEAFSAWKRQFGFDVKGRELPPQYLENCIAVATHRPLAEELIANMKPAERASMGISGLCARVRKALKAETASDDDEDTKAEKEEKEKERRRKVDAGLVLDALKRIGLAILVDGEETKVVVNDEARFAAWSAARPRPVLTIEGKVIDLEAAQ